MKITAENAELVIQLCESELLTAPSAERRAQLEAWVAEARAQQKEAA
jgi:hypothetical protein